MRVPGDVLLDFRDVHTHYGSLHVLKGVSYEIREGEIARSWAATPPASPPR